MSIKIMNRVWTQSQQKGTALLALLAIADNADDDGRGFPGISYLAKKTRMSERQVQRLMAYLDSTDELAVEYNAGRGASNVYYVLTGLPEADIQRIKTEVARRNAEQQAEKGDKLTPFRAQKGDKMSPFPTEKGDILSPKTAENAGNGDIQGANGDIFCGNGDIAMSPEPINHLTVMEPSGTRAAPTNALPVQEAWELVKTQLSGDMRPGEFASYIKPLEARGVIENRFVLRVVNAYTRSWLESRWKTKILRLLEAQLGHKLTDLAFELPS